MKDLAAKQSNVFFEDHQPCEQDSKGEILIGLRKKQKTINPKYFYDTRGSELFEDITQLPEYYPTRVERSILANNAAAIAECCGEDCVLIEPGSGSSEKVRLLLNALKPIAYVPMDIAGDFLQRAAKKLGEEFTWLNVLAVCADFGKLDLPPVALPKGKRVIFYPGSTLGNMTPEQAVQFLMSLKSWLNDDGGVVIGIDLHKSEATLNAAYNDQQGVTAEFNLNVLNNVNAIVDGNFDSNNFTHFAYYNQQERRIEMHLKSKTDHIVRLGSSAIAFSQNETIHTENSYKYTLDGFRDLVETAGFALRSSWLDDEALFSVHYLEVLS